MTARIVVGDVREVLCRLPDASVHCCVTSPPYFGLRDYKVAGQMGLEKTPDEYVAALVEVFREVRRVLRDDGTLWLNLGDSYAGSWGAQSRDRYVESDDPSWHGSQIRNHPKRASHTGTVRADGVKPKDLYGIPWRVAFALQADAWYLRQDIIWHKPNPMPESVRDRCTKAHEYIFMLAKSGRPTIWQARDSLEWNSKPDLTERLPQPTEDDPLATGSRWRACDYYYDFEKMQEPAAYLGPNSPQSIKSPYGQGFTRRAKGNAKTFRGGGKYTKGQSFDNSTEVERESHGNVPNEKGTRNRRSVWTVTTKPFKGAHFATFPPDLIEPCILAGCPAGGTVLDPFFGAGTTGLVANKHGRHSLGIELNSDYAEIARVRIGGDTKVWHAQKKAQAA